MIMHFETQRQCRSVGNSAAIGRETPSVRERPSPSGPDRERDEAAIERWCGEDWPRIKKKACEEGWSMVVIDETGFMLQPVVRRSWAPRGQTPIQYS